VIEIQNILIGDAASRIQTVIIYKNSYLPLHVYSAPNTPTYFPSDINRLPYILDILVTKSIQFSVTPESLSELDSDHNPVKIHLNSPLQFYRSNNSLFKGKSNWRIYSDYLNKKINITKNINTVLAADKMAEQVIINSARVCSDISPPKSNSN